MPFRTHTYDQWRYDIAIGESYPNRILIPFCIDRFYESVNVVENRKQRLHFHSFMRDVLRHYHQLYTRASTRYKDQYDDDLLRPLAKAIAK